MTADMLSENIDRIVEMISNAFGATTKELATESFTATSRKYPYSIVDEKDQIVGVHFILRDEVNGKVIYTIETLTIHKDFRKRMLAKQLIHDSAEHLATEKLDVNPILGLGVRFSRATSVHAFKAYTRMGFTRHVFLANSMNGYTTNPIKEKNDLLDSDEKVSLNKFKETLESEIEKVKSGEKEKSLYITMLRYKDDPWEEEVDDEVYQLMESYKELEVNPDTENTEEKPKREKKKNYQMEIAVSCSIGLCLSVLIVFFILKKRTKRYSNVK